MECSAPASAVGQVEYISRCSIGKKCSSEMENTTSDVLESNQGYHNSKEVDELDQKIENSEHLNHQSDSKQATEQIEHNEHKYPDETQHHQDHQTSKDEKEEHIKREAHQDAQIDSSSHQEEIKDQNSQKHESSHLPSNLQEDYERKQEEILQDSSSLIQNPENHIGKNAKDDHQQQKQQIADNYDLENLPNATKDKENDDIFQKSHENQLDSSHYKDSDQKIVHDELDQNTGLHNSNDHGEGHNDKINANETHVGSQHPEANEENQNNSHDHGAELKNPVQTEQHNPSHSDENYKHSHEHLQHHDIKNEVDAQKGTTNMIPHKNDNEDQGPPHKTEGLVETSAENSNDKNEPDDQAVASGKTTKRHLITEVDNQKPEAEKVLNNQNGTEKSTFEEGSLLKTQNFEEQNVELSNRSPFDDTLNDRGLNFRNSVVSELKQDLGLQDEHDYTEYEIQLEEHPIDRPKEESGVIHSGDESLPERGTFKHSSDNEFNEPSMDQERDSQLDPQTSKNANPKGQKKVPKPPKLTGHALHINREIEGNIRRDRLQDVLQQKKDLEEKLKGVHEQIKDLSHSVDVVSKVSPQIAKIVPDKDEEAFLRFKAQQLVQKLNADRKIREQREQQKYQRMGRIIDKEYLEMHEYREYNKMRMSDERHEEILKRMEERERARDEREARLFGGISESHMKSIPLYKQLEQQGAESQLQELERRKQFLAERRQLYKPFKDGELENYEKKYQGERKFVELDRRKQSSDQYKHRIYAPKIYESKFMRKVKEYDKEIKEIDERKDEERQVLNEKKQQYGKAVRDVYLPDIKEREQLLQTNIKNIIERTETLESYDNYWKERRKHPISYNRKPKITVDFEQEHLRDYYGVQGGSTKSNAVSRSPQSNEPSRLSGNDSVALKAHSRMPWKVKLGVPRISKHVDNKLENSAEGEVPVNGGPEEGHEAPSKKLYPNYIEELKKKRQEYENKGLKYRKQTWEKHLKDEKLSYAEKVTYVLEDVKSIEGKAKEREAWLKENERYGTKDPREQRQEIDDLYADSIRAKIAILGGGAKRS